MVAAKGSAVSLRLLAVLVLLDLVMNSLATSNPASKTAIHFTM
jgi:hypothetical protein